MKPQLNEIIEGRILSVAMGGAGLMRHGPFVIFVPFTAPGDLITCKIVKIKKNFGEGELVEILEPSRDRVEPRCPYFGTCGGCQLQHISYGAQVEIKRKNVQDALERIGGVSAPVEIDRAESPYGYREKILLHLKGGKFGYIGLDNESLLEVRECPIFTEDNRIFQAIQDLNPQGDGRLAVLKDRNGKFLVHGHFKDKVELPGKIDPLIGGFSLSSPGFYESIGNTDPSMTIEGLTIHFSAQVFIQNNFHQSVKIYSEINSLISQGPVLDLYSGIGITSLILAKKGLKVTSVEVNRASVEMARKNGQVNGLAGVNYLTGDAKAIAKLSGNFYAAIVNPPREGLEEQVIHELLRLKPKTILYISCNPSTLARDLVKFKGYGVKSVKAFDMFPQTGHIETLVQLVSL